MLTPTKKPKGNQLTKKQKATNSVLLSVWAIVEHTFRVLKRQFGLCQPARKWSVVQRIPRVRAYRQIAKLGGFLGRKCDGELGVKTLWLGMQRLHDFIEGMAHMRKILNAK